MNRKRKNHEQTDGESFCKDQPKRQRENLNTADKTIVSSTKRGRERKLDVGCELVKLSPLVHQKAVASRADPDNSSASRCVKEECHGEETFEQSKREIDAPFSTKMTLKEFVKQEPSDALITDNSQSTFDDFTVHNHPDIESSTTDQSKTLGDKSQHPSTTNLPESTACVEKSSVESAGVTPGAEAGAETGQAAEPELPVEQPQFAVPTNPVRVTSKSKSKKPKQNSNSGAEKKKWKKKDLKTDSTSDSPSKAKSDNPESGLLSPSNQEAEVGKEKKPSPLQQAKLPKSSRSPGISKSKKSKIRSGRMTFNSGAPKKPGLPYGGPRRRKTNEKPPKSQSSLLQDQRLAKHACVLWSSENRRYYQQLEPSASSEQVEASMARAWEQLGDKEKLRYYQRAWSALSDLNKAGTKRGHPGKHGGERPAKRQHRPDTETAMKKFCDLTDMEQKQMLWDRMLRLQGMMTRQSYRRFVTDFLRSFRNTVTTLRQRQDINADNWKATMEGTFRRLLFGKILQEAPLVDAHIEHRKYVFQKEVRQNFDRIVTRLIAGKRVCFDPRVRSTSMDLLLQDLEEASFYTELNMESLVMELLQEIPDESTSSTKSGKNVEDLISTSPLDCYRLIPISTSMPKSLWNDHHVEFNIAGEKVPVPLPTLERSEIELLRDSSSSKTLAVFSAQEVEKCFEIAEQWREEPKKSMEVDPKQQIANNMYDSWYRMNHGLQQCCPLDSPSCILSDALVLDKLRKADMRQKYQNSLRFCNPTAATPSNDIKSVNIIPVSKIPAAVGQANLVQLQNLNPVRKPAHCVTTPVVPPIRPAVQEIIPIRMPSDKPTQDGAPKMLPKVTKILIPSSSATRPIQPGNVQPKKSGGTTLTFHTVRLSGPTRPVSSAPSLSILNPITLSSAVQKPVTPHITVMVRKPGAPVSTVTEVQKSTAHTTVASGRNPECSVVSSGSCNVNRPESSAVLASAAS